MQLPAVFALLAITTSPTAAPSSAPAPALDQQFQQSVRPFITKNCVGCHSGAKAAAQFDLKAYTSLETVTSDFSRWSVVMDRLKAKEMPPKPMPQPPDEAREQVISWIQAVRAEEIRKTAGDPGLVLARRLSNAEYNYTVRDLTGHDMQLTRQFPVDPANTAGFDNSGESLTMSSSLLNKYLQTAREVANHMVLTPDTIDFSATTMLAESDREKYAIERILAFYARQPVDYTDYFGAAWRYRYRKALGEPHATLASVAAETHVSPKYLPVIWDLLQEKKAIGPIAELQTMWRALPAPHSKQDRVHPPDTLLAQCMEMREFVVKIRAHTAMQFAAPVVKGLAPGSQPLLNWKLREYAAHRRESDPKDLRNDTDPAEVVPTIPKYPDLHREAAPRWAALSAKARAGDPDLVVPAAQRARYQEAFAHFASVFPDTFFVTERGRYFPDDSADKGRYLSAGYHSVVGYFRDDTPLVQLVLNENETAEINKLWEEFDFIANVTDRTWTQYYFNQSGEILGHGPESASPRPADHAITDTVVIEKMRDAYLAKAAANPANDPVAATAIRDHFDRMNATLRHLEKERADAEAKHLAALGQFAERAYRRPLTAAERTDLLAYYRGLREKSQLSHEDAVRDCIVSVLMSPDFLYRLDLSTDATPPSHPSTAPTLRPASLQTGKPYASEPLSSYSLASRLSYFLWSSMPDAELLRHAAADDLHNPDVLRAQTRRMLRDERIRGLATEFTGNWLSFRQFETNNSVDRQRFPTFNDDLREAMFQEPIRLVQDAMANNRSVLDLIYAKRTFVNPPLAKHYNMPAVHGDVNTWVEVEDASPYGRGGLLPMAVFMTQNSPGLRTSPVKRGNWVVQRVLGIRVPPPPPVVPELPSDESKSDRPVREMLAQHRANPVCAACHAKFDSFGLAYEGYGPVGDVRTHDLAGRPVDTAVTYPGNVQGTGLAGLQTFIRDHRQNEFVNNLSRKMLAYALNRSLQLSDESQIDSMQSQLAAQQFRFDALVESIVFSPQFLNKQAPVPPTTQQQSSQLQPASVPGTSLQNRKTN